MVSLTLVTPPIDLDTLLPAVKAHLLLSDGDSDEQISRMIAGAAAACSRHCGRGFGLATYAYTLDGFPGQPQPSAGNQYTWLGDWPAYPADIRIRLPLAPLVSASVTYFDVNGDSQTMAGGAVWVGRRTGQLSPAAGVWPITQWGRPEAIEVQFVAGDPLTAIPPQALRAILLTAGSWWGNRADEGAGIPPAAKLLLAQLDRGNMD